MELIAIYAEKSLSTEKIFNNYIDYHKYIIENGYVFSVFKKEKFEKHELNDFIYLRLMMKNVFEEIKKHPYNQKFLSYLEERLKNYLKAKSIEKIILKDDKVNGLIIKVII